MAQRTRGRPAPATDTTIPVDAEIVADAFIFGYPILLMDATRRLSTACAAPTPARAPTNRFAHRRMFPDATFTDSVTPNVDTLYSLAWLDLAREPIVLSVPEMGTRYYLMPMLDAWTNVLASPGTRTTGNGARHFAITGPGWSGTLPERLTRIDAATSMVWIIGRTQTNGRKDFDAVHAIQDQYLLRPLSECCDSPPPTTPSAVDPTADTTTAPPDQVARMDAAAFFGRLNALMVANPPSAADAPALARFARLGIGPGKPLDADGLDPAFAAGLALGRTRLTDAAKKRLGARVNGWDVSPANTARFGTDYLSRAIVALLGLGANLPEDAVAPRATVDAAGEPLRGAHRYVLRFPRGTLPPVRAFWSLTIYDTRQALIPNAIHRYALGGRDPLITGADGSLTLYLQHDSPDAAHETNWLPAPADHFTVVLRMYWPSREVSVDGWRPPPIERVQ